MPGFCVSLNDVGWFDAEEHSTAVLTTRLESDAAAMAKACGLDLGQKVQLLMTLLLGILIGLVAAWQVGLVAMATMPLIGESPLCLQHRYLLLFL